MCAGNPYCGCHHGGGVGLKPYRGMKIVAGPAAAESPAPPGGTPVSYAIAQGTEAESLFTMMAGLHKALTRIERRLWDASHPVDERYSSITAAPLTQTLTPDFELRVRIESILLSIPVGVTSASVKLGQDTILAYSGAATTVQTIFNPTNLGIQLDRDDERIVTFAGAPTTGFFIALAGHALETWGDR